MIEIYFAFAIILCFIFFYFRFHVTETVLSVTAKSKFIRFAKNMQWAKIRQTADPQTISARAPISPAPLAIVDGTYKGRHVFVLIDVIEYGAHQNTTIFVEHDAPILGPVGITRREWSDISLSSVRTGNPLFDKGYELTCPNLEDMRLIKEALNEQTKALFLANYLFLSINSKGVYMCRPGFSESEFNGVVESMTNLVERLDMAGGPGIGNPGDGPNIPSQDGLDIIPSSSFDGGGNTD